MLVLDRKVRGQICVGDMVITVLAVKGCRVKLGFEAPAETRIMRREIVDDAYGPNQEWPPGAPVYR